jgi:hypothetical protein
MLARDSPDLVTWGSGTEISSGAGRMDRKGVQHLCFTRVSGQDEKGRTALSRCASGDHQCVRLLLQAGADVDLADKDGISPLHYVRRDVPPSCLRSHFSRLL